MTKNWKDLDNDLDSKRVLREVQRLSEKPSSQAPEDALTLLYRTACGDTGGSQVARYFLFLLVGQDDPTGFKGEGLLELRRLDPKHQEATLKVFTWWTGSVQSDEPLSDILVKLNEQFSSADYRRN